MADLLSNILSKASNVELGQRVTTASNWLKQAVRQLAIPSPARLINHPDSKVEQAMTRGSIGRMYMFGYDAKLKKQLPYWDAFPLIIPFRITPDGFYGLNLHYLPPMLRAKLLDGMSSMLNNDKFDDTTKFRVSWESLQRLAMTPYYEPCVKRYLNTHVKTSFMFIPPDKWELAVFLPLARFKGASEQKVFNDATKRFK